MDVLIRLGKKGGFYNFDDARVFFEKYLKSEYDHFCSIFKIHKLEKNDIMYFVFKNHIVAIGKFLGGFFEDKDNDFPYCYKIEVLKIFYNDKPKISNELFKGRVFNYIKTKAQKEELYKIEL